MRTRLIKRLLTKRALLWVAFLLTFVGIAVSLIGGAWATYGHHSAVSGAGILFFILAFIVDDYLRGAP